MENVSGLTASNEKAEAVPAEFDKFMKCYQGAVELQESLLSLNLPKEEEERQKTISRLKCQSCVSLLKRQRFG